MRLQTHSRLSSRELAINQVEVLGHDHIHVCDLKRYSRVSSRNLAKAARDIHGQPTDREQA
jgi:hypothetical protein